MTKKYNKDWVIFRLKKHMKKICLVCNLDLFWTQRYVENVAIRLDCNISAVSENNAKYIDFYGLKNIKVYLTSSKWIKKKIKVISGALSALKTFISIQRSHADVIIVQYADRYIIKFFSIFHFKVPIIFTFWGSDLLRAKKEDLIRYSNAIYKAKSVVVMTEEMKTIFCNIFPEYPADNVYIIDMGISAFDAIDSLLEVQNVNSLKLLENVGKQRKVITIGYNAIPEQQHIRVINVLKTIPNDKKKDYFIVLPMTYGRNDLKYCEEVNEAIKSSGFDYIILDKFMDDEEIAQLCCATDYFINVQTTDALAASLLEQLYSKSIVISGEWLKYSFLDTLGIHYIKIGVVEDIYDAICNNGISDVELKNNHDLLSDNCSWEVCRNKWAKLLSDF